MRGVLPVCLGVLAVSFCPCTATAQPRDGVQLAWARGPGGEGCPDEVTLAARVRARLGWDPFALPPERFVEGVALRERGRLVARLFVRDLEGRVLGTRELSSEAQTCDSLGAAVTLAVALAIDPEAASRPVPPAPVEEARPSPLPAPPPAPPPRPPTPGGDLTALAVGTLGLLPGLAVGFGLEGRVALGPRLSLQIGSSFFPEVRPADDPNFAFGLATGALGLCFEFLRGERIAAGACGTARLGALHATVLDESRARPGQRLYAAVAAGPRIALALTGRWEVVASGGLAVPVRRHRFTVEGAERTVFVQPWVGGFLGIGVGVRWEGN